MTPFAGRSYLIFNSSGPQVKPCHILLSPHRITVVTLKPLRYCENHAYLCNRMIIFRRTPIFHRNSIYLTCVWSLICLTASAFPARAQTTIPAIPADQQIAAALKEVSADRIRADITKLVSFQNRSTLSAQDASTIAAGRGIAAARAWIKSEFENYSRACGGCLEVRLDSFTKEP